MVDIGIFEYERVNSIRAVKLIRAISTVQDIWLTGTGVVVGTQNGIAIPFNDIGTPPVGGSIRTVCIQCCLLAVAQIGITNNCIIFK